MSGLIRTTARVWQFGIDMLDHLSAPFLLAIRLYLAYVFIKSGLTKVVDFSSTVALFENEYKVPFLSPTLAAVAGTAAEFILPALFALGLASRPTAVAFFVFNAVACLSYPDISMSGIQDHELWGFMMLVVLFQGPGAWSLDRWIQKKYFPR